MTTGRINQVVSYLSIKNSRPGGVATAAAAAATGAGRGVVQGTGGLFLLSFVERISVFAPAALASGALASSGNLCFCELSQCGQESLIFVPPASPATLSTRRQPPPPLPPLFSCCSPQLAACGPPWTRAPDPVLEAFGRNPDGRSTAPGGAVPLARSLPY